MRLIDAEWLEDLLLMHEQNARAIEASGRKVSFTYADGIRTGYADVGLCPTIKAEPVKQTIEKFRDYQIEWLTAHNDIEFCEEEESLIIGFLKDTAECAINLGIDEVEE